MVEALHASGFLAGLKRMLQRKWSKLPAADVDDSVADAVESAYTTVSSGRRVGDLGAWLWKAADNIANDRWERNHAVLRELDDAAGATAAPETTADERQRLDARAEHRRAEAIRSGSLVQVSGRNSSRPIATGTSPRASVSDTSVWQLRSCPASWRIAAPPRPSGCPSSARRCHRRPGSHPCRRQGGRPRRAAPAAAEPHPGSRPR